MVKFNLSLSYNMEKENVHTKNQNAVNHDDKQCPPPTNTTLISTQFTLQLLHICSCD